MKKIKIVVLACLVLLSCNENETLNEKKITLTETLNQKNDGIIKLDEKTYVINKKGYIQKFTNENLEYNFDYKNEFQLKISEDGFKKSNSNELIVTNLISNEFIIFKNQIKLDENTIKFDALTSNGILLKDLTYTTNKNSNSSYKCPACWVWVSLKVVEIIVDAASDNYDSNCKAALSACGDACVASIQIIDGWFTDSCTVTCKED